MQSTPELLHSFTLEFRVIASATSSQKWKCKLAKGTYHSGGATPACAGGERRVGAGADCRSDLAAKAISLGLNDEEMAALVGITPPTLFEWKKDPEFFEGYEKRSLSSAPHF
jgi:hypothetical protein